MENSLLKLMASLSQAEKRQFKLSTKKQAVPGSYLQLFILIEKHRYYNWEMIKAAFKSKFPASSIESTATYLYKLLVDTLIQNKINNDETYKLLYSLLQIKILQERNLATDAYAEIKKNKLLAEKYQELPLLYMLKRKELNYLSGTDFTGIKEKELISKQIAAKDLLRDIRNIQEHHTLYELLKHRLSYTSQMFTDETKTNLNDLILSEIAIINTNTKQSLESRRLHLFFQSFFFIKTRDYRSALRTFYILNELYESKLINLQHPPIDYYLMLDGILDSLAMIDHYQETDYFLNKLMLLDKNEFPDYFRLLVRKTILLTKLRITSFENKWKEAVEIINSTDSAVVKQNTVINQQKQTELLFYISLSFFKIKNRNKAIKYINNIVLNKNVDYASLIYRMARLFNVIIYYENRDLEYLDYEIRSYKRIFKGKIKILVLEKFIFQVVKVDPVLRSKYNNQQAWQKLLPVKDSIINNKYESQLLKYFNFLEWAENLFNPDYATTTGAKT